MKLIPIPDRALAAIESDEVEHLACDLAAAERLDTARLVDRRGDALLARAVDLIQAGSRDPRNAVSYARAAAVHLVEALRLDAIEDEHREAARGHVTEGQGHGQAVISHVEMFLSTRAQASGGPEEAA